MPKRAKRELNYLRVTITYTDGESSGNRVFKQKDRDKAERWAERQKKSPVVKRVKIEPFTQSQQDWLGRRAALFIPPALTNSEFPSTNRTRNTRRPLA